MNYKLWEHGVDLDTGKEYVNEVKKILLSLKSSLEEDLEEGMQNKGFWNVSRFFRNYTGNILFCLQETQRVDMPGITTGWREGWEK